MASSDRFLDILRHDLVRRNVPGGVRVPVKARKAVEHKPRGKPGNWRNWENCGRLSPESLRARSEVAMPRELGELGAGHLIRLIRQTHWIASTPT